MTNTRKLLANVEKRKTMQGRGKIKNTSLAQVEQITFVRDGLGAEGFLAST
jgi:hypothetical protein